jgi:hypothetical protein
MTQYGELRMQRKAIVGHASVEIVFCWSNEGLLALMLRASSIKHLGNKVS